ncbi:3417_t:CDS:2, partial [Dentiscutata heterogama]
NMSDNTTYEDWGMVIDWNGKNKSNVGFGISSSYLEPDNSWIPSYGITINRDPRKGFLRFSLMPKTTHFAWEQYMVDTIIIGPSNGFFIILATLDSGYAIVYNQTENANGNSSLEYIGLYSVFLAYNQTKTSKPIILFKIPSTNITLDYLACSVDYVFIGYVCILNVNEKITATTNANMITTTFAAKPIATPDGNISSNMTVKTFYKIRFLSTGSVVAFNRMFSLNSSENDLTFILIFRLGGYTFTFTDSYLFYYDPAKKIYFYDEYDKIINLTNFEFFKNFSVVDLSYTLLPNNTFLNALKTNVTTETNNTWRLLSIDIPQLSPYGDHRYNNLQINSTIPAIGVKIQLNFDIISITFHEPISYSNGNLTIFQRINQNNSIIRQIINSRTCNCSLSDNQITIQFSVLHSTFNKPGGQYYIQMDYDFVKSAEYNEPMLGIDQHVWAFETGVSGKLLLTKSGSQYFQILDNNGKHDFFIILIKELTDMIPIEQERLSSNEHYQLYNPGSDSKQIIIMLSISESRNNNESIASVIKDDLNLLILEKEFTAISGGNVTKYLDESYGFQLIGNNQSFIGFYHRILI